MTDLIFFGHEKTIRSMTEKETGMLNAFLSETGKLFANIQGQARSHGRAFGGSPPLCFFCAQPQILLHPQKIVLNIE